MMSLVFLTKHYFCIQYGNSIVVHYNFCNVFFVSTALKADSVGLIRRVIELLFFTTNNALKL